MRPDADGEDFATFVARAWPGLVRTALLLTGDRARAEDLAQEALVRTHRRWRSVRRSDAPTAYVRAAMVNLHRSWWRRRARREVLVDATPDRASGTGDWGVPTETDEVLAAALATLPPRMRATLVLRFYEDLSEHQTAQTLGCAVGTVKSQTARGLERWPCRRDRSSRSTARSHAHGAMRRSPTGRPSCRSTGRSRSGCHWSGSTGGGRGRCGTAP